MRSFSLSHLATLIALSLSAPLTTSCGGTQAPPPAPPETTSSTTTTTMTSSSATTVASTAPSTDSSAATSASSTTTTTTTTATATNEPEWSLMTHEQKLAYMKSTFFPKMKEEFVAFDGKMFEKMSCVTCHGDGAKDGTFTMPNPKLPKLDPAGEFKKHKAKTPKLLEFMFTKVEPDAAKLLGEKPYDMKTHEGFGCFDCHTMAGK